MAEAAGAEGVVVDPRSTRQASEYGYTGDNLCLKGASSSWRDGNFRLVPPPLPQVTISHDIGGSLVEYHNFSDPPPLPTTMTTTTTTTLMSDFDRGCCDRSVFGDGMINCSCNHHQYLPQRAKSEDSFSRANRSHSLTPSVGFQQSCGSDPEDGGMWWGGGGGNGVQMNPLPSKMRSNSITFGVRDLSEFRLGRDMMDSESLAPERSGMRDLRDWMKSLRLHKYTERLLPFSYEELLALTESDLNRLMFTDGAKGKFLKQISLIKERPVKIKELKQQLEEITELKDLLMVLPELEKLVLMPLKPASSPPLSKPAITSAPGGGACGAPASSTSSSSLVSAVSSLCRQERRHDSGSDSGTEMVEEATTSDDLPQETFDLLEKTFSIIICKQLDDSDRDRLVLHFYRLLDRRCLRKEGFTSQQKQWFLTWLKRMDQVWDISRTTESTGMDAKRKYEWKSSPPRRSSLQPPLVLLGHFPRGPVPFCTAPPQSSHVVGNGIVGGGGGGGGCSGGGGGILGAALGLHGLAVSSGGPCLSLFNDRFPETSVAAVQRRSVPDINPPVMCPQLKRNSYQGDHRMPPLVDSEVLRSVFDYQQNQQRYGFGLMRSPSAASACSSFSSGSRRASTLSTTSWDSGFSRRSSTMSSCGGGGGGSGSRRNSSISEDGGNCSFLTSVNDSYDGSSSYLSVDVAAAAGNVARKGTFCNNNTSSRLLAPGSVSSGCVSDEGSTDSLEHDLHKLSLAVTEQALLE